MVKCEDCSQEMLKAESCTRPYVIIDNKEFKRDTSYYDVNKRCHDCGIVNGEEHIHHFGCDVERCPKCGGQLISCSCPKKHLAGWVDATCVGEGKPATLVFPDVLTIDGIEDLARKRRLHLRIFNSQSKAKKHADENGGVVYTQVDSEVSDERVYSKGLHIVNRTGVWATLTPKKR